MFTNSVRLSCLTCSKRWRLVNYLKEYSEYLVVALLPEDAAALNDLYARLTEI